MKIFAVQNEEGRIIVHPTETLRNDIYIYENDIQRLVASEMDSSNLIRKPSVFPDKLSYHLQFVLHKDYLQYVNGRMYHHSLNRDTLHYIQNEVKNRITKLIEGDAT